MFFRERRSIGLDIADHTIEVVEVEQKGKTVRVVSKARTSLPFGMVEHGQIKQPERLAEILRALFTSGQPVAFSKAPVIFGLPESQVYTHTFRFSNLSEKQIQAVLPQTVASAIPVSKEKIVFTSLITYTKEAQTEVVVVATHTDILKEWQEFFAAYGFAVAAVDSETLASFRDLFPAPLTQPVCIIDMGAMTTFISIFDTHGLRYTRTVFLAGEDLTHTIAEAAHLDYDQAEQEKVGYGIGATPEKEWRPVLLAHVDTVIRAIRDTISFFERTREQKVNEVVVIGGSAQLPGLLQYIQEQVGCPTRLGKSTCSEIPLEYIEAVGLARFGLKDSHWKHRDPIFTFTKKMRAPGRAVPHRYVLVAIFILGLCAAGLLGYQAYRHYRSADAVSVIVPAAQREDTTLIVVEESASSTPEMVFRIVTTGGELTPIYEEPTSTAQVITEAESGEQFRIVTTTPDGEFTAVEIESGVTGWINSTRGEELVAGE